MTSDVRLLVRWYRLVQRWQIDVLGWVINVAVPPVGGEGPCPDCDARRDVRVEAKLSLFGQRAEVR